MYIYRFDSVIYIYIYVMPTIGGNKGAAQPLPLNFLSKGA